MLGIGCVIVLLHSLNLPYNDFVKHIHRLEGFKKLTNIRMGTFRGMIFFSFNAQILRKYISSPLSPVEERLSHMTT